VTAGAYKFIREHNIGAGKRVAILLPDSSRNYMSKFMDDGWMKSTGFNIEDINESITVPGVYDKLYSPSATPKLVERDERAQCSETDNSTTAIPKLAISDDRIHCSSKGDVKAKDRTEVKSTSFFARLFGQ
jgi:hypothetical protein